MLEKRTVAPTDSRLRRALSDSRPAIAVVFLIYVAQAAYLWQVQGTWVVDDAYITFRYVHNLLNGFGLVFNPGERVEGYTNFLWLVLLTPFTALHLDTVHVAQALGLLSGLAILALTRAFARHLTGSNWIAWGATLLLLFDASFARWAVDGMETLLFALLLTAALYAEVKTYPGAPSNRRGLPVSWQGLLLGLAALTRPEGLMVIGYVSAYRVFTGVRKALGRTAPPGPRGPIFEDQVPSIRDRAFWRALLAFWGCSAALVVPHLIFRLLYYHDWVPNTAHAKLLPGLVATVRGLKYVFEFGAQRWGVLVGLIVAFIVFETRRRRARPRAGYPLRFLAGLAVMFLMYIVTVGGDWMNRARYFMHFGPVLAILVAETVARWTGTLLPERGYRVPRSATALFAGMLAVSWYGTWTSETTWLHKAWVNHLERRTIIRYLKTHAPPGATLLSEEIGEIPYYTGMVTFDVFGLTDWHIAHAGRYDPESNVGHQRNDFDYSLSLDPDYILMTVFRDFFERDTRKPVDQARYPLLRKYTFVPMPISHSRLELYKKKHLE